MEWLFRFLLGVLFGLLIGHFRWYKPDSQESLQNEVIFMYVVKDDNPDVGYGIGIGEVTDSEGNVIENAQLSVEVTSDNEAAVSVEPAEGGLSGSIHFGAPGQATLTANVKSASGVLLATGAASFTVTTGDPAAVAGVSLSFEGLSEV